MKLTIVRHGHAGPPGPGLGDGGRCLSLKGRAQVQQAGRALAWRSLRPDAVWTSPLARAVQTAEILAQQLAYGGLVDVRAALLPEAPTGDLLAALAELPDDAALLVAGHEPCLSRLAVALAGPGAGGFRKADAAHIDVVRAEPGGGALLWRWDRARGAFSDDKEPER